MKENMTDTKEYIELNGLSYFYEYMFVYFKITLIF